VVLEKGFLFLVLKNIGGEPATKATTKIGGRITGPDGKMVINDLNVFRSVEFFAPGKEFHILVGSSFRYFSGKQPTRLTAVITYSDENGRSYSETINHDLTIYKGLPYRVDGGGQGPPDR
jgi:hypothetical protein